MSDSACPHRRPPTRLLCPWDSPGKNTGVGCHFLLQCMKVKSESEVAQLCPTLSDLMDCSLPGSSVHGIFQARVLEWGAIAFSRKFSRKMQILDLTWEISKPGGWGPEICVVRNPPGDSNAPGVWETPSELTEAWFCPGLVQLGRLHSSLPVIHLRAGVGRSSG